MKKHLRKGMSLSVLATASCLLLSRSALADDGGISYGGSPHLLSGHPSVQMKSEKIDMDIHDKTIKVDCNFVFHNSGPACTVRMGFPDRGEGAAEPYQGEDHLPTKNLKATFTSYDSYVDGKKVPTKLVPTNDRSIYWHTKTVTFKGNADTIIRDVYTVPPGAQTTNEDGLYQQTEYILHTGSSWHGPIGNAEINIKFSPDAEKKPINVKPVSSQKEDPMHLKWSALPPGTVLYKASAEPEVKGQTLRFVKSNFKPTKSDDIQLYYAFHLNHNM